MASFLYCSQYSCRSFSIFKQKQKVNDKRTTIAVAIVGRMITKEMEINKRSKEIMKKLSNIGTMINWIAP